MHFIVEPSSMLESLRGRHLRLICVAWAVSILKYLGWEVYEAPASTAHIERNQKIDKQVLTSSTGRMGEGNVETQVSVIHEEGLLQTEFIKRRLAFESCMDIVSRIENRDVHNGPTIYSFVALKPIEEADVEDVERIEI